MIDLRTTLLCCGLLLSSVVTAGCNKFSSPDEAMAALKDEDLKQRIRAADYLRRDGEPTAEATQLILKLIVDEKEPRVYGAMLQTLGASGVPEARPLICEKLKSGNVDMRRWATNAAFRWAQRNGLATIAIGSQGQSAMFIDAKDFCGPKGSPPEGDGEEPPAEKANDAKSL